jgi:hypothetical protein
MAKHKKFNNEVRLQIEAISSLPEQKEQLLTWMKETNDPQYTKIRQSIAVVNSKAELTRIMFMMQLKSEGLGVN